MAKEMIRTAGKKLVARTVVDFIAYVRRRLSPPPMITVHDESQRRAVMDSVDYADLNMQTSLCFGDVHEMWRYAFAQRSIPGMVLEFGVFRARSTNFFARLTREPIHGFDSFEGLKEEWAGWMLTKGHFSLGGRMPEVASNVRLIKGWFDETLPGFLSANPGAISFLHIDCDTYESTKCVLNLCACRIVPGTVVLFDEYFGYRGWRIGEFKAWHEFITQYRITYSYRAFCGQAVLVTVDSAQNA